MFKNSTSVLTTPTHRYRILPIVDCLPAISRQDRSWAASRKRSRDPTLPVCRLRTRPATVARWSSPTPLRSRLRCCGHSNSIGSRVKHSHNCSRSQDLVRRLVLCTTLLKNFLKRTPPSLFLKWSCICACAQATGHVRNLVHNIILHSRDCTPHNYHERSPTGVSR